MNRAQRLTEEVRKHDRELYVAPLNDSLAVFRKTRRTEVYDLDGDTVVCVRIAPHLVFSLTENWNVTGRSVEWGIEPIMARLRAMDLWQNPNLVNDLIKGYEKGEESRGRDRRNNTESFLYEFRDKFAKSFNDVNTSGLKKIDKRRINDRKMKEI